MNTYRYEPGRNESYDVWLEQFHYANRRKALVLMDEEGPVATVTVNIPDVPLGDDEIHVKTWGENEQMLNFLVHNKIVHDTGQDVKCGYANARVAKLLIQIDANTSLT